jgi:chromosomal replication initiation ATPase DnaA
MRSISAYAAKYGTNITTTVVNRILSDIEEGKQITPELIAETRAMMNDLRIALTNEIYGTRKG